MPLTAQVRRERRGVVKKFTAKEALKRRRCKNCDKLFDVTRPNRIFCSDTCRDEYHRYGSAFGPMKAYLTLLIEKASKEEAKRQLAAHVAGKEFRAALALAGFIHRSQIKPLLRLATRVDALEKERQDHESRLLQVEWNQPA
jgi:hypothetical protein